MPKKKMTEEHKAKIQEARKLKKQKEESQKVTFKIGPYSVESYDYGFMLNNKNIQNGQRFYSDLRELSKTILRDKIKTSGAKDLKTLIEVITKAEESVVKAISKIEVCHD